jgi:sulfite exporter TauE/SafE
MNALRIVLFVLGIILILVGLIFVIAASEGNTTARVLTGLVMVAVGLFLAVTGLRKSSQKTVVIDRDLELTGDVSLEDLSCRSCGASLSSENVTVRAGAVFAACPFCKTEYQLEEEPKW